MVEILKYIADLMDSFDIPYDYNEWRDDDTSLYFVGTIDETTADGRQDYMFTLNGFSTVGLLPLVEKTEKIKNIFPSQGALRAMLPHSGVALFFDQSFNVPTDSENLWRIQIKIKIKQYKKGN